MFVCLIDGVFLLWHAMRTLSVLMEEFVLEATQGATVPASQDILETGRSTTLHTLLFHTLYF